MLDVLLVLKIMSVNCRSTVLSSGGGMINQVDTVYQLVSRLPDELPNCGSAALTLISA